MNNIVIIIIGWLLGQIAYAIKKSWDIQKKTPDVNFVDALKLHFSKETASFAFGTTMLLIVIFILPDFVNLDVTKEDIKDTEAAKWKWYLINFLRIISVFFGYLCQQLGYYFFGRTEKILEQRQKDSDNSVS